MIVIRSSSRCFLCIDHIIMLLILPLLLLLVATATTTAAAAMAITTTVGSIASKMLLCAVHTNRHRPLLKTSSSSSSSTQTHFLQQQQQQQRHHRRRHHPHYECSSSTSSSSTSSSSSSALKAVSLARTFLFDGGELQSFLAHGNGAEQPPPPPPPPVEPITVAVGCLTLVAGTTATTATENESRRVVGVQKPTDDDENDDDVLLSLGDDVHIYQHTAATIPPHVSDDDAVSTAAASLVGIHCALLPDDDDDEKKVYNVGGSRLDDVPFYSGKAVVLGGNDLARFVADGLAALGMDVSLVSTGGAKTTNERVKAMHPSVEIDDDDGTIETGFANAIGRFDVLVDTLANERKGWTFFDGSAVEGLGTTTTTTTRRGRRGSSSSSIAAGGGVLLSLLRSRHGCNKYISTTTHAQQIVKNDGILFGPGRAHAHVKAMMESISLPKCRNLVPSAEFGPSTLQTLFDNNVIFPARANSVKSSSVVVARGWNMNDFWEETLWPRDSSGTTGVRYGLPVLDDDEEDDDEYYVDDESQPDQTMRLRRSRLRTRIGGEGGMDDDEVKRQTEIDDRNPHVTKIVGVDGLTSNIVSSRRSSVVFVSMRSCRTCKRIDSVFTKMARECNRGLMYAKADTAGWGGKLLGRRLGVIAVPAFVLFRDGVRYGSVSTATLPSDRLDKAIRDMEAGEEFDTSLEEGD